MLVEITPDSPHNFKSSQFERTLILDREFHLTRMGSLISTYNMKKKFDLSAPIAFLKQKDTMKPQS